VYVLIEYFNVNLVFVASSHKQSNAQYKLHTFNCNPHGRKILPYWNISKVFLFFPVYKYPYLLAFTDDAVEIRTTSNGSLVKNIGAANLHLISYKVNKLHSDPMFLVWCNDVKIKIKNSCAIIYIMYFVLLIGGYLFYVIHTYCYALDCPGSI